MSIFIKFFSTIVLALAFINSWVLVWMGATDGSAGLFTLGLAGILSTAWFIYLMREELLYDTDF